MQDARSRTNIDSSELSRGFKAPRCRRVVLDGNRPRPNVFRGLAVGIVLVPALLAPKVQALAVGRGDRAAGATAPACVAGAGRFPFDSARLGHVGDLESHRLSVKTQQTKAALKGWGSTQKV